MIVKFLASFWKISIKKIYNFFSGNIMYLFAIVLIIASSIASDKFLEISNLMIIFRQVSVIGVLAIGSSIAIIVGGIDISLTFIMVFNAMLMGVIQELPIVLIILIVVLVGLVTGTITGLGISYLRVVPFIATMAMSVIMEGSALLVNDGKPIFWGPQHKNFFDVFGRGFIGPIPVIVLVFFLLAIIGQIILVRTRTGINWRAIGGDEQAAFRSGVRVRIYKTLAYAISGMFGGIASIFLLGRIGVSDPTAGGSWIMDMLAVSVLGGTIIGIGGRGSISGVILGAFILGTLNNIFNLTGVSTYLQYISKGIIVMIAIIAARARKNQNSSG